MTRKVAIFLGGVILLLGAAAVAVSATRGESAGGGATGEVRPPLFTAELGDLEVLAEAPGTVEPIRTVEVKSRASGEVLRVHAETGDRVERGQLLAEIDPRDVQNALDQAIADLESAEVQASTSEANRARMETLRQASVITQQEYEGAVQAAAIARAAVVRARTDLQLAREQRNDVVIRAPIAGTIITDNVEPGQIIASATGNVSGGTVLFTMADLASMQVRTLVDESDIGQIAPALPARVTVEAYPGRTFAGEVHKVEPQAVVSQNVTTFPVLVRLSNPEGLLKPGMNAEVAVEVASRRGVVVIPNGALVAPRDVASAAAALGVDPVSLVGGDGGEEAAGSSSLAAGGPPQAGADVGPGERRPVAVVFVPDARGLQARRVVLGVGDWERTEVIEGLQAGETVLDVAGVQLQHAQQEELDDRRQARPRMIGPSGGRGAGG